MLRERILPMIHTNRASLALSLVLFGAILLLGPAPSFSAGSVAVGDEAPLFSLPDMQGVQRSLESHLGKDVVLLDFWSIYCVSCVQAIPEIIELYEKYKDQGFIVYGVDLDSFSPKRVQRFIDGLAYKIPYPTIVDQKREIAGLYKVGMLPTTVIIGKDGVVRFFHIGYKPGDEEEFERLVKDLLN